MALIKCPHCGNFVSDKTAECPVCGKSLNGILGGGTLKIALIIISIVTVLTIIGVIIVFCMRPNPTPEKSQASNSEDLESIVLTLCEFIPDHGLRKGAERHLTESYFWAYSEAFDAPYPNMLGIGSNEFLYYFVSAQDGEPLFSVKSVMQEGDYVFAEIYIQRFEDAKKEVHTLKILHDNDLDCYRIDDFDDTKKECRDFVKEERAKYKSGEYERDIRECGGTSIDVAVFRKELQTFYAKYGKSGGNVGRGNCVSSADAWDEQRPSHQEA